MALLDRLRQTFGNRQNATILEGDTVDPSRQNTTQDVRPKQKKTKFSVTKDRLGNAFKRGGNAAKAAKATSAVGAARVATPGAAVGGAILAKQLSDPTVRSAAFDQNQLAARQLAERSGAAQDVRADSADRVTLAPEGAFDPANQNTAGGRLVSQGVNFLRNTFGTEQVSPSAPLTVNTRGLKQGLAAGAGTVATGNAEAEAAQRAQLEPPAAAPAPSVRNPQFDETGARLFTNADIGGGAANRGTASVEENIGVASRLADKGARERAAGLRAAGAAQGDNRSLDERILGRLAGGSGLASAFGALAAGGNVLRQRAAERGFARSTAARQQDIDAAAATAAADRNVDIAKIAQTQGRDFANQLTSIQSGFAKARESGTQDEFLDSTARAATDNPNGPEAAFYGPIVGNEIREAAGKGFLTSLNPATERGIFDWLASFGQGGQAEPLLTPEGQVTINSQTGSIEIVSPDGSTRQELFDLEGLPPRSQEYLRALGTQLNNQELANQPGDPNLRGRQALTLRDARQ